MNWNFSLAFAVRRTAILATAALAALVAAPARAFQPYEYGFESTSPPAPLDWSPNIPNPSPTPSGGGVLNLTAPQGSYYYETVNQDSAQFAGYGASGASGFGIPNADGDPIFTGNYAQSIQVYIDPVHWAPGQGFAIDGSPGLAGAFVPTLGNNANPLTGGIEFNDEIQIQVSMLTAGKVTVSGNPGGSFATITTPGWYTFVTEFNKSSGGPTAEVVNNVGVFTATGHLVGALENVSPVNNTPVAPYGATFQNQMLGGANYIWITDWQNGFANDRLGIDNIQVGPSFSFATPEPASLVLFSLGLLGIGAAHVLRRRKA